MDDNMLTGTTRFQCVECDWRETLPIIGIEAAETATAHHPEHVIVRVSEPPKRKRRRYTLDQTGA